MSQIDEVPRTVPGAEMFFGETVAQYLAELSSQMYEEESECEGLLLGRCYHDTHGDYVIVSGATQNMSADDSAVGWFTISPDAGRVGLSQLRRTKDLFGKKKVYLMILNSVAETMAIFSIEGESSRIVPSVMVENL